MSYAKAREVLATLEAARIVNVRKRPGKSDVYAVQPFELWASLEGLEQARKAVAPPSKTQAKGRTTVLQGSTTPLQGGATLLPDSTPTPLHSSTPPLPDSIPELQGSTPPLLSSTHEGNPIRESKKENQEREPAGDLLKAASEQGLKPKPKAAPKEPTAPIADTSHQRLMAKRVEVFGKTTAMAREAKAAKWLLENFTEAEIYEYMAELQQAANERGFTASLELVSRQIDAWKKRKTANVRPVAPAKRFLSQADMNRAGTGRVVL